jgi:hypothetical protein
MIDSRINNRLRVAEKHLDLALDQLKEENNDGAKYLIYNALSTIGQIQEIVEFEEQKAFRLRRRDSEDQEG